MKLKSIIGTNNVVLGNESLIGEEEMTNITGGYSW